MSDFILLEKEQAEELVKDVFDGFYKVTKAVLFSEKDEEKKLVYQPLTYFNNSFATKDGTSGLLLGEVFPIEFCKKKSSIRETIINEFKFSGVFDVQEYTIWQKKLEKNINFASYGSKNSFGAIKGSSDYSFPIPPNSSKQLFNEYSSEYKTLFKDSVGPFKVTEDNDIPDRKDSFWISFNEKEMKYDNSLEHKILLKKNIFVSLAKTLEGKESEKEFFFKYDETTNLIYLFLESHFKAGTFKQCFKALKI
jgi:hypothetical protein